MAQEKDRMPQSGSETDISKARSQQRPPNQAQQDQETFGDRKDRLENTGSRHGESHASGTPDEGMQGDTLSRQRETEDGSFTSAGRSDKTSGGFVASKGENDSSGQLIDDQDEEFARDGQGAPERE